MKSNGIAGHRIETPGARLSLQDRVFAPHSENLFRQAGIGSGLQVADAGCGAGDTTRLLARIVGPAGLVIGIDSDATSLEAARQSADAEGLTNVCFVQDDPRRAQLGEPVDALAGRAVLCYLDEPGAALAHMTRWVRPGGIVTFQEFTLGRTRSVPDLPLMARSVNWTRTALRQAGIDPEFGDSLPDVFRRAGLPHPGFAAIRVAGDADSLLPDYLAQTTQSLTPLIVAAGAGTADEIAQCSAGALAAQARQQQATLHPHELAAAWARRPMTA